MATSYRKDWVCGWCLNTGARPFGWRWVVRWTRCLACNINIFDRRSGPEIADSLRATKLEQILNSPTNRAFNR